MQLLAHLHFLLVYVQKALGCLSIIFEYHCLKRRNKRKLKVSANKMCSGDTFWSAIFFVVWQSDADHFRNSSSRIDIKKNQSIRLTDFPSSLKPTTVNSPQLRRSFSQKDMSQLHDGYSVSHNNLYLLIFE